MTMLLFTLLSVTSIVSAAHVTCNVQNCGGGKCGYGNVKVRYAAIVDGKYDEATLFGTCQDNTSAGCAGLRLGNGVTFYNCGNNPFNIPTYCVYDGHRIDLGGRTDATQNCENTYSQGGPYSIGTAWQEAAVADV